MSSTNIAITPITIAMANTPQMGDSTHHHDQSITWQSFSTMNTIVSSPENPIPPDAAEDDELLILLGFWVVSLGIPWYCWRSYFSF
jgi:hypothetical protein